MLHRDYENADVQALTATAVLHCLLDLHQSHDNAGAVAFDRNRQLHSGHKMSWQSLYMLATEGGPTGQAY